MCEESSDCISGRWGLVPCIVSKHAMAAGEEVRGGGGVAVVGHCRGGYGCI